MGIRVRCVDPNAHDHNPRELADSDHVAACGDVIDVDAELAGRLVQQPDVWQVHEDDAAALEQALAELAAALEQAQAELAAASEPTSPDAAATDPADEADVEHLEEIQ